MGRTLGGREPGSGSLLVGRVERVRDPRAGREPLGDGGKSLALGVVGRRLGGQDSRIDGAYPPLVIDQAAPGDREDPAPQRRGVALERRQRAGHLQPGLGGQVLAEARLLGSQVGEER